MLPCLTGFNLFDQTWKSVNKHIEDNFPEAHNISTESLVQILDDEEIVLLDVRRADEFAVSHIRGAIHTESVSNIAIDHNSKIIVYCSVGYRSAKFADQLQQIGYTRVFNLRGSIFEWANKGYPLHRGTVQVYHVHPYNERWGKLLDKKYHSPIPVLPARETIKEQNLTH